MNSMTNRGTPHVSQREVAGFKIPATVGTDRQLCWRLPMANPTADFFRQGRHPFATVGTDRRVDIHRLTTGRTGTRAG